MDQIWQKGRPSSLGKESLVDMGLNAHDRTASLDTEGNLWAIVQALQEYLQIIGSRLSSVLKFNRKEDLFVWNPIKIRKGFYRSVKISDEWFIVPS
jgi:hypothetical protein